MLLKNKKYIIFLSALFIVAEIVLSVLIHKIHGEVNTIVSYAAVVFACLFAVLFAERTKVYFFTQAALVMTVLADYFLVILPEIKQFPAMVFFSIAQIAYFARIYVSTEKKRMRVFHCVLRLEVVVFAVILTFIVLRHMIDAVSVISMFYFANLIVNIIFAFAQFKKNYLLAVGLLLFACCDVLIGFSFLGNYLEIAPGSFAYKLAHPGMNLAWVFYVPSQTLLALSLMPDRLKKISSSCNGTEG